MEGDMANTTDSNIAPVGDDDFRPGATAEGYDFERRSAPPFGDPDQHLYGGGWHGAPFTDAPTQTAESPYEGRHRAAD